MTNITENAKVTQGVAEANAENNSVKTNVEANATVPTTSTHINVAEDIINAMFNDYADDFKELASEPSRTAVNWFVPKDADALVKIQYHSYSQINDNKQVLYKICDTVGDDSFVRLPDNISILLRGNQVAYASYSTVRDYIKTLKVIAEKYSSRWTSPFDLILNKYMKLEDYTDQEGLVFEVKGKDYLANECVEVKVWTLENRLKIEDLVSRFRTALTEVYQEHPTVMVKLAPRSQGKIGSAIIKSAM
tara:strand:- start:20664 stop:21407 length:744 start_codon:yes stop_codon:yes gene_type:complete